MNKETKMESVDPALICKILFYGTAEWVYVRKGTFNFYFDDHGYIDGFTYVDREGNTVYGTAVVLGAVAVNETA